MDKLEEKFDEIEWEYADKDLEAISALEERIKSWKEFCAYLIFRFGKGDRLLLPQHRKWGAASHKHL